MLFQMQDAPTSIKKELLSFFLIIVVLSSPVPSIGFLFRVISRFNENKDLQYKEYLIKNINGGDKRRLRCVSLGQLGATVSRFPFSNGGQSQNIQSGGVCSVGRDTVKQYWSH